MVHNIAFWLQINAIDENSGEIFIPRMLTEGSGALVIFPVYQFEDFVVIFFDVDSLPSVS